MKFAKELEDDLVPEWRVKYFNYKLGKKKVKAVTRALRTVNRSPQFSRPTPSSTQSADRLPYTFYDFSRRNDGESNTTTNVVESPSAQQRPLQRPALSPDTRRESLTLFAQSPPVLMPESAPQSRNESTPPSEAASPDTLERTPLHQQSRDGSQQPRRYGSIPREAGEPPAPAKMPALELPDPALDLRKQRSLTMGERSSTDPNLTQTRQQGEATDNSRGKKTARFAKDAMTRALESQPGGRFSSARLKKLFHAHPMDSPNVPDGQTDAVRDLDAKQDDFFNFLDKELKKIEKFYKSKEEEATARLEALREQLHEMRDQVQHAKSKGQPLDQGFMDGLPMATSMSELKKDNIGHKVIAPNIIKPLHSILKSNGGHGKNGKTSQVMLEQSSPPGPAGRNQAANGDRSDYVRRKKDTEHVPYKFARRRLKLALQEFYRGLELLKSYALLNRTAFRKINKKYDKAVNARPTLQYMTNKVNDAQFVKSNVIESHLVAVEDLYARYFERGHHKIAVNKLRSKMRQGDQSSVAFRNGLYLAAGTGFAIAGLVNAGELLFTSDQVLKIQTAYLLQLYGGYFLGLLLFLLFVLDCRIWQRARVNYVFVFEFDTRHVLDWRQLAELPCFFLFLNGFFLWLNFEFSSAHPMYLYWPVILIGLTLLIIAFPAKVLYYHSRKWFGFSNWRLLLAGIYPVEFRDFFFGDMYCSETYAMSQIELFFCVYANRWVDPTKCNSNHSMLLGFFTALPAIWRANQCLRRYYDTRSWFPHLANFMKYLLNIVYYMTLSLYRLKINQDRRIVFIVFAALNGIYSSLWDVFMDWSLGNPWARHPFLRKNLAYRRKWVYYAAIVADVVLRHQWIVYAIFTHDLQHSAFASFAVGLAEVFRRGIWSLFRVENEHCNNVKKFRASRDVPLPYTLGKKDHIRRQRQQQDTDEDDTETEDAMAANTPASPNAPGSGVGTAVDLERQTTWDSLFSTTSSVRRRNVTPTTPGMRTLQRVGTLIASAHAQDFTKKRRDDVVGEDVGDESPDFSSDDDEEEDHEYEDDDSEPEQAPVTGSRNNNVEVRDFDQGSTTGRSGGSYSASNVQDSPEGSSSRSPTSRGLNVPTARQRHAQAHDQNEEDIAEARTVISRARSPA